MREMVLADDDFRVDAEISGAAENFDDASRRGRASTRIAQELHVNDSTVELFEARDALGPCAFFGWGAQPNLGCEAGRQLIARRNFDFMLHASVVWQDNIAARAVSKQAYDGGVCATENADDAALGSLTAGDAADTRDLHLHAVAVHGVLGGISRDEHIARELQHRRV